MPYRTIPERRLKRFMDKVEIHENGCWEWTGWKNIHGYGGSSLNGKQTLAHRISYMLLKGEIPDGMDLDHLCRNRLCVNPDHLEPVTRKENIIRGFDDRGCPNGHPYINENISIVRRTNGKVERRCKICHRDRNKKSRDKKNG